VTRTSKPIIHNRDHEHGGADPVRIHYETVGTGGGGTGFIQFGVDNNGDWISIDANGSGTDPLRGTSVSIRSNTDAPIEFRQEGDADLRIINDGTGDLLLQELGGGDFDLRSSNGAGTVWSHDDLTLRSHNGNVIVSPDGFVLMPSLPTSDPHVVGQVWSSSGTLKVSAG
jgi:hypothetical protein